MVVDVHCVRLARDIAPHLDRARIAIAGEMRTRMAPLAQELGIDPDVGAVFAMLRNLPPDRTATRAGVDEVFIYHSSQMVEAALGALARDGNITSDDPIAVTPKGVDAIDRMAAVGQAAVSDLWVGVTLDFDRLVDIAGRVIDAAAKSGGKAFAVVSPPYVSPGATPQFVFAEQLTPLRFHRFDAHVAAWRAAGLTVEQAKGLAEGSLKDSIEAATNERASLPYQAISPKDRVELLRAVSVLP